MSVLHSGSKQERFDQLYKEWKLYRNQLPVLSYTDMFQHPAYQEIIGWGKDALPFILNSLKQETDHWWYALRAINDGYSPVPEEDAGKIMVMAARWLAWGRANKYIE